MSQVLRMRYTPEAAALIRRLHPEVKQQIRKGIRDLLEDPLLGHELRFDLSSFRSYRVKSYRILYQHNERENFMEVYYVGHRRDVYESFRSLLLDRAIL
jgi:addiction module RelE/StbE family toxin